MLPAIRLGQSSRTSTRTPIVLPTINLSNQLPAGTIRLRREKKEVPKIIKIIGSPALTVALVGTLAAIAAPATVIPIVKSLGAGALKTVAGSVPRALTSVGLSGVLISSPTARGIAKSIFNPVDVFNRGRGLGGIIEDPSQLFPKDGQTLKEKALSLLGTAGKAAAIIGLTVGAGSYIKKFFAPKLPTAEETQTPSETISSLIPSIVQAPTVQSFGAAQPQQPQQPTEKVVDTTTKMPVINNKITVKPNINVSFRKTRKFINQQILCK